MCVCVCVCMCVCVHVFTRCIKTKYTENAVQSRSRRPQAAHTCTCHTTFRHTCLYATVSVRDCVCVCACMHSEQTRSHRHQGASARQHAPQTCCKPQACCTPPPAPLDAHSGTIRARAPPGRRVARCAAPQTLLPRGLTRTCVCVLGLWRVCVQAHEQACLHLNTHK